MEANGNVLRQIGTLSIHTDEASIMERIRQYLPWYARKAEEAREQALYELEQRLIEQKHREVGHM